MSKIVGIKELHRNLKSIAEEVQIGQVFIVVKHGKPIFEINPYQNEKKKKYTLADFKKLQFKSGSPNLSQEIDQILYA